MKNSLPQHAIRFLGYAVQMIMEDTNTLIGRSG